MRHIVICGISGSNLFHKPQDFQKKKGCGARNVLLDFLYNFSEKFLILGRIQRDIITQVHMSPCKVLLAVDRYQ